MGFMVKRLLEQAEQSAAADYLRVNDSHVFDLHAAMDDDSLPLRLSAKERENPGAKKAVTGYASRDDIVDVVNYMVMENAHRIESNWNRVRIGENFAVRRDPLRNPDDFATTMLDQTPAIGIFQDQGPAPPIPTKSTNHVLVLKKQASEPWARLVTVYAETSPDDYDPDPRRLLNGGSGIKYRDTPRTRPYKPWRLRPQPRPAKHMGEPEPGASSLSAEERRAKRLAQREAAKRERTGTPAPTPKPSPVPKPKPSPKPEPSPEPSLTPLADGRWLDEDGFEVVKEAALRPGEVLDRTRRPSAEPSATARPRRAKTPGKSSDKAPGTLSEDLLDL